MSAIGILQQLSAWSVLLAYPLAAAVNAPSEFAGKPMEEMKAAIIPTLYA
jgi:hypothetical protein